MNIIFGDAIKLIPDSYTVLELDTSRSQPESVPVTAYCVIEKIPLHELPLVDAHCKLHSDILAHYRDRHWDYCEQAIESMIGKWNSELDTFYTELQSRVRNFRTNPPSADWDGVYIKPSTK